MHAIILLYIVDSKTFHTIGRKEISGMKYRGNEVLRGIEITGTNLVKASCKISARVDHMELPQSARLLLLWKLWKSACCRNSSS